MVAAVRTAGTPNWLPPPVIRSFCVGALVPVVLVAGETVRLRVLNGGLVAHELTLGDEAVQAAWARADAAVTPPVRKPQHDDPLRPGLS